MTKFVRVIVYEYSRHVFRIRFFIGLISIPILLGVMVLAMLLSLISEFNLKPIGYVDHAGLLGNNGRSDLTGNKADIIPYEDEMLAAQALENDLIQGYFVIEADYPYTRVVRLIARKPLSTLMQSRFTELMRDRLLSDQSPIVAERVRSPNVLAVRSLDGKRLVSLANLLTYFIPTLGGFILLFATFTTSGYLMSAIIEERANRTMEILITSLTPWQLIGGKTVGLAGVGLTQLLFWTLPLWVVLYLRQNLLSSIALDALPLDALKLLAISFIPAFLIIAALMTTLGAMVADQREGQTIASLIFLPVYLPFAFYSQIIEDPNGPLAIGLSIFPVTAPVTLSMRHALDALQLDQIVLILALQSLLALGTIWLAGYIWRLGMLQYGRRLGLSDILGRKRKAEVKL